MHHPEHYPNIIAFIAGIGLPIAEAALPDSTFLPGIALRAGGLIVDPDTLHWPGDLLHEAGHLAVLPAAVRAMANDDLVDSNHIEHASEIEAMAWAYAAAIAIGLPLDILIHEGGYKGRSPEVLSMYGYGIYPGLRGLCETGMAASPGFGAGSGDVHYPQMLKWLRD
jgi:hypothetical protein